MDTQRERKTVLYTIQDTVKSYAEIISIIADVDVEVVDEKLVRIAGTGLFRNEINQDMSAEGYVYKKVLATGKRTVIYQPGEELVCRDCPHFMNCQEEIEIAMPIMTPERIIGVIGLVGSSREQKVRILNKEASFLKFVEQIADFISAKAREKEQEQKREALVGTLYTTLEHVEQGTLIVGASQRITFANKAACEQLEETALAGERIAIRATGDSLNKYAEYSVEFKNKQFRVMGTCFTIPQPNELYRTILIFYRSREIKNQYFETSYLAKWDKDSIIGTSPATQKLKEEISKVAQTASTVLITGESGTGKEMVATSIWRESDRKNERFIALNCAAIPENLMESELFGYVKGAFTGADPNGRMGKFELANGGIIFLDEIGDMPMYLQSKLLRVLQQRQIIRIGSNQLVNIDVRVIAATNKDLLKMVREKRFREDLYYRLNVIPLRIRPLRERQEDIADLAVYYSERFSTLLKKPRPKITEALMDRLKAYPWPGNVRELENAVEYMVNLMGDDGILDTRLLPEDMKEPAVPLASHQEQGGAVTRGCDEAILPLRELEKQAIQKALQRFGSTTEGKMAAARALGIGKATLYRKLQEYEREKASQNEK